MTRTLEDMYPIATSIMDHKKSLLIPTPTAAASANVKIAHAQLRHLIACPAQRGIVYYVGGKSILERDVLHPNLPPRSIIDIDFLPTCFAATAVSSNPTTILFAAGGHSSDFHLSLHTFPPSSTQPPSSSSSSSSSASSSSSPAASPKLIWRHSMRLRARYEIVNSILFTPASLTDDTSLSSTNVRVAVGGNDSAVRLFEVALQANVREGQRLLDCGGVKLETPVNHMSFSPDGRTLLCVGDLPKAYLFSVSPGSTVTFSPLAVYTLPPPPRILFPQSTPQNIGSQACFSTAWSTDGLKFAVASQEGQLCVWDVRSAIPVMIYWTPYRRNSHQVALSNRRRAGEWEWEDLGGQMRINDDAASNGPDSGIRNVKFSAGEGGRELLVFTEHTFNIHVMDARTLDPASHSVLRFPDLSFPLTSPTVPVAPTEGRTPSPGRGSDDRSPPEISAAYTFAPSTPRQSRPGSPMAVILPSRSRSHSREAQTDTTPSDAERRPSRSGSPAAVEQRRLSRSRTPSPARVVVVSADPGSRTRAESQTMPDLDVLLSSWRGPNLRRGGPGGGAEDEQQHALAAASVTLAPEVVGEDEGMFTTRLPRFIVESMQGEGNRNVWGAPPQPRPTSQRGGAAAADAPESPVKKATHLGGMCFDPTWGWLYVGSENGIVEWRVREREEGRMCWGSGTWA